MQIRRKMMMGKMDQAATEVIIRLVFSVESAFLET